MVSTYPASATDSLARAIGAAGVRNGRPKQTRSWLILTVASFVPYIGPVARAISVGRAIARAGNSPIGKGKATPPAPNPLQRPEGVPASWLEGPTNTGGGVRFVDPASPAYNQVRIMPGSPNSPWPNSQAPYVRWMHNGQYLDRFGNPSNDLGRTHIPLDQFEFLPEIFAP